MVPVLAQIPMLLLLAPGASGFEDATAMLQAPRQPPAAEVPEAATESLRAKPAFDPNTGVWDKNEGLTKHVFAPCLAQATSKLLKKLGMKSIADLGCGNGHYSKHFRESGLQVRCFDGNPSTEKLTDGLCGVMDLSKAGADMGTQDFAMSLEVGEHIPKAHEQDFLNNVANAATRGVLLSWAIVGQGGTGHVNCQNNDYIMAEMKKRGFTYKEEESLKLREEGSVCGAPWFKNTIMLFLKAEKA